MKKLIKKLIPVQITITKRRNSFLYSKKWIFILTTLRIFIKLFILSFFLFGLYSFDIVTYYQSLSNGTLWELTMRSIQRIWCLVCEVLINTLLSINYTEDDFIQNYNEMDHLNYETISQFPSYLDDPKDTNLISESSKCHTNDQFADEVSLQISHSNSSIKGESLEVLTLSPEDLNEPIHRAYYDPSLFSVEKSQSVHFNLLDNILNYINNITASQLVCIGGCLALTVTSIYYGPAIWAWGVGVWQDSYKNTINIDVESDSTISSIQEEVIQNTSIWHSSWNKLSSFGCYVKNYISDLISYNADESYSEIEITNFNLGLSTENLAKLESQLDKVSTIIDKLDASVEKLNNALENSNNIAKSSLETLEAANVLNNAMQTKLDTSKKFMEIIAEAVMQSYRLADRLFCQNAASQTVVSTTPSPDELNIQCPLEISEVFNNLPTLPWEILVLLVIVSIYLFYIISSFPIKLAAKGESRYLHWVPYKPHALIHLFIYKIKSIIFTQSYNYLMNQINRIKWFLVGYLTSWYIGVLLEICTPFL